MRFITKTVNGLNIIQMVLGGELMDQKEKVVVSGIPIKIDSLKEALNRAPIVEEIGEPEPIKPIFFSKEADGDQF